MTYRMIICTLALWIALPLIAHAQELHQWRGLDQPDTQGAAPDGLRKLHITDKLANSPEGRKALEDFHRRKALGLLPRVAKQTHALGDTMTFEVRNNSTDQGENIDFELMAVDESDPPRFQIWVELAEIDNENITADVVEAVQKALAESTPEASLDSTAGILELDELVFGEPPDVDGDGLTDVLLVDIRDDFDQQNNPAWLAGFVDGRDLSNTGNNRDVLYLDTEPTLRLRGLVEMEQTAAHEYQHLIHFNYDRNETTFMNEGLSEWAEVLCGYLARSVDYLNDVDTYNVAFLRFSADVFQSIDDRQRGRMFINYIADRFGEINAGFITRQAAAGSAGIRNALTAMQAGISYEDLLADFHLANYLNDTSLDPRYGYTTEQNLGLQAAPGAFYDGRTGSETPATSADVSPGAVQYLLWDQVKDFEITLNAVSGSADLRAVALLFQGQSFETSDLTFGSTATIFEGDYDRIAVVVTHVNPDGAGGEVAYSAVWTVEQTISLITTQYDNGQAVTGTFFTLGQTPDPNVALTTRFIVPFADRGTTLDKVFVAPYYSNQFANPTGTPEDPRDFKLYIFGPGGDGQPGDTLFSRVIDDPRAFRQVTSLSLDFAEIDLSPFAAELSSLPDTIYVGYTEAGVTTETMLVVGVSQYLVENVSFIGNIVSGNWGALWEVQFSGGDPNDFPVVNTVIPIRAQFAVVTATATEDAAEVPESIVLYPNFPNPFNPTTSIRYALPQAAEVRLAVYDVLGRQVAVLAEGTKPPGEHLVAVDAARWASGMYFYTIEAAGQKQTRRMVLIK